MPSALFAINFLWTLLATRVEYKSFHWDSSSTTALCPKLGNDASADFLANYSIRTLYFCFLCKSFVCAEMPLHCVLYEHKNKAADPLQMSCKVKDARTCGKENKASKLGVREGRLQCPKQWISFLFEFLFFSPPNFLDREVGEFLQGNAKLSMQILIDTHLRFEDQAEEWITFFIWIYLAMTVGLLEK